MKNIQSGVLGDPRLGVISESPSEVPRRDKKHLFAGPRTVLSPSLAYLWGPRAITANILKCPPIPRKYNFIATEIRIFNVVLKLFIVSVLRFLKHALEPRRFPPSRLRYLRGALVKAQSPRHL